MQVFYFDNEMCKLEKQGDFRQLIKHLEGQAVFSEENFSTQIAYSWYLYSEGDFVSPQVSKDWEFYKKKWEEKLKFAIENYQEFPKICFIVAYSLEINGMDISDSLDYEGLVEKFFKLSKNKAVDNDIVKLLEYITSRRIVKMEDIILERLFPNNTLIDKYFLEVLS